MPPKNSHHRVSSHSPIPEWPPETPRRGRRSCRRTVPTCGPDFSFFTLSKRKGLDWAGRSRSPGPVRVRSSGFQRGYTYRCFEDADYARHFEIRCRPGPPRITSTATVALLGGTEGSQTPRWKRRSSTCPGQPSRRCRRRPGCNSSARRSALLSMLSPNRRRNIRSTGTSGSPRLDEIDQRLDDLARRVERLERQLAKDAGP